MENLPVTIIVKAPNQQIEDQTVRCERTWSINRLKEHLSEVYPSKPAKEEQKLIYSGHLLIDSDILEDVLREYDGQDIHTVHLVCSSKNDRYGVRPEAAAAAARSGPAPPTGPQRRSARSGDGSTQSRPAATTATAATGTQAGNAAQQRVPHVNMPWATAGAAAGPMDPAQYAMHLAWMQQAYIQYMNQYMQLAAANSYAGVNPPTGPPMSGPGPVPPATNEARPAAAAAAPPQEPAAPAQPPAAAGPLHRDPDNPERDWLDTFYILSRILVLFSVVYFYSSPVRFIFVLLLGFSLYFYHIGFFRTANNNNNNNTVPPMGPVQEEQAPSRLNVVWTFFTTFFASLIPEIPNPI